AGREAAREAGGERLLPVLASRATAVRERLDDLFPGVTSKRLTVADEEGWASGTSAADRAALHPGGSAPARVSGSAHRLRPPAGTRRRGAADT
ncbi:hypothetical protein QLR68_27090, partial [Micromonospora sp. DH15]|nr:hypothetical protein [Micromonospora sp. DH15]